MITIEMFYRVLSRLHLVLALAVCVVMIPGGCGNTDTGTAPNPTELQKGWTAFEAGDYTSAESAFGNALIEEPTSSEVQNGLGWTKLRLGLLAEAVAAFETALTNGFSGATPFAGLAIGLRDLEPVDYAAAIAAVLSALAIDSSYTFEHDADLDWMDLRLIMAQSHFALGEYTEASAQVTQLGGAAPDSESPEFVDDLLEEIERLGQAITD